MASNAPAPITPDNHQTSQQPSQGQKTAPPGTERWNTTAIIGFVLALLPFPFFFIPFISIFFSLVGLPFSIIGLIQAKKRGERGQGLAIAGIILNSLGIITMILLLIAFLAIVALTTDGSNLSALLNTTMPTEGFG